MLELASGVFTVALQLLALSISRFSLVGVMSSVHISFGKLLLLCIHCFISSLINLI